MKPKFDQFIRQRQYLMNVSPATIQWYTHAFKNLHSESPSQTELQDMVVSMRERGMRETGCNSVIRAINSYLKWLGSPERVLYLKEPERLLPTLTATQVKLLVKWKPKTFTERRLHLLVLILLDTGCRISEVLGLRCADCDLDNLLFTVTGKGRKTRRIPFSLELRRVLARYIMYYCPRQEDFVLASRDGHRLGRRDCLRDVKQQCRRLGFMPPERTIHAFRHTYATNYLRRGGSVAFLQRLLGHSDIQTTMAYVHLATEDLQAVHQQISLLAA
jgi:integrase/recombinase XerD